MPDDDAKDVLQIHYHERHHVTLTLHRPHVRHALDPALLQALTSTLKNLCAEVRTVLIKASGPVFCAGADLAWMRASRTLGAQDAKRDAAHLDALFAAISDASQVIVCAVQGAALGGGAGLVAAADIAIASDAASFAFGEVHLGLVAAVISPYVINKVGLGCCREWLLTGRRFDANEAQQKGLVSQVVPPDNLEQATDKLLESLWRAGPEAQMHTKRLLQTLVGRGTQEQREEALNVIAEVRVGDEAQEGMSAFFEKRSAAWRI